MTHIFERENTVKVLAVNVKYHLSYEAILDLHIDPKYFNLYKSNNIL